MAENQGITPDSFAIVASDEVVINGIPVNVQRIKVHLGVDGSSEGDVGKSNPLPVSFYNARNFKLLESTSSVTDGAWVAFDGLLNFSVQVKGTGTATLRLHVSNEIVEPPTSSSEAVLATLTPNTVTRFTGPYRWLKASVSSYTSGTYSILAEAL